MVVSFRNVGVAVAADVVVEEVSLPEDGSDPDDLLGDGVEEACGDDDPDEPPEEDPDEVGDAPADEPAGEPDNELLVTCSG